MSLSSPFAGFEIRQPTSCLILEAKLKFGEHAQRTVGVCLRIRRSELAVLGRPSGWLICVGVGSYFAYRFCLKIFSCRSFLELIRKLTNGFCSLVEEQLKLTLSSKNELANRKWKNINGQVKRRNNVISSDFNSWTFRLKKNRKSHDKKDLNRKRRRHKSLDYEMSSHCQIKRNLSMTPKLSSNHCLDKTPLFKTSALSDINIRDDDLSTSDSSTNTGSSLVHTKAPVIPRTSSLASSLATSQQSSLHQTFAWDTAVSSDTLNLEQLKRLEDTAWKLAGLNNLNDSSYFNNNEHNDSDGAHEASIPPPENFARNLLNLINFEHEINIATPSPSWCTDSVLAKGLPSVAEDASSSTSCSRLATFDPLLGENTRRCLDKCQSDLNAVLQSLNSYENETNLDGVLTQDRLQWMLSKDYTMDLYKSSTVSDLDEQPQISQFYKRKFRKSSFCHSLPDDDSALCLTRKRKKVHECNFRAYSTDLNSFGDCEQSIRSPLSIDNLPERFVYSSFSEEGSPGISYPCKKLSDSTTDYCSCQRLPISATSTSSCFNSNISTSLSSMGNHREFFCTACSLTSQFSTRLNSTSEVIDDNKPYEFELFNCPDSLPFSYTISSRQLSSDVNFNIKRAISDRYSKTTLNIDDLVSLSQYVSQQLPSCSSILPIVRQLADINGLCYVKQVRKPGIDSLLESFLFQAYRFGLPIFQCASFLPVKEAVFVAQSRLFEFMCKLTDIQNSHADPLNVLCSDMLQLWDFHNRISNVVSTSTDYFDQEINTNGPALIRALKLLMILKVFDAKDGFNFFVTESTGMSSNFSFRLQLADVAKILTNDTHSHEEILVKVQLLSETMRISIDVLDFTEPEHCWPDIPSFCVSPIELMHSYQEEAVYMCKFRTFENVVYFLPLI